MASGNFRNALAVNSISVITISTKHLVADRVQV
jgi:hypothetical protein